MIMIDIVAAIQVVIVLPLSTLIVNFLLPLKKQHIL